MSQDAKFVTVVSTGALARVVQEFDDGSLEAQPLFEDEPVVLACGEWDSVPRIPTDTDGRKTAHVLSSLETVAKGASRAPQEVLREFVEDVEAVGTAEVLEDGWTDLLITWARARAALNAIKTGDRGRAPEVDKTELDALLEEARQLARNDKGETLLCELAAETTLGRYLFDAICDVRFGGEELDAPTTHGSGVQR